MSSFRIRPTFTQIIDKPLDVTRKYLVAQVEKGEHCELKTFPGFICLRIPEQERQFWSPRLNLSLYEADGGKTRIEGTYGPNANMWSAILYGYLLVGSISLFSGIFGCCQAKLGMQPWGLWIFGLMISIAIGMYLMAQMGQKLGARQMFQLHQIYEAAMGTQVEIK